MVSRVTTCEGASADYRVTSLPDTPFRLCYTYLQFPNMDLVKKSVLNTLVSNHDGNDSIIARYLLYCPAIHYCIQLLFPAIIIIYIIEI